MKKSIIADEEQALMKTLRECLSVSASQEMDSRRTLSIHFINELKRLLNVPAKEIIK